MTTLTRTASFKLDNTVLAANTSGLSYRSSKNLGDKKLGRIGPDDLAVWGTTVDGVDHGDGWVQVGNRYLPKELNGVPVVIEHADPNCEKEVESISTFGKLKDVAKDPVNKKIAGSAVGGAVVGGAAGGTVGATAGGIIGGVVGVVGAPFTLGLSIPIAAAVGGGIGLSGGVVAGGGAGLAVGGAVGYHNAKKDGEDAQHRQN